MAFSRKKMEEFYCREMQVDWITVDINCNTNNYTERKDFFHSVEQWCIDVNYKKWSYDIIDLNLGFIHFKDEEDAILFKLAWH